MRVLDRVEDPARLREAVYRGDIAILAPTPASVALVERLTARLGEVFAPRDPRRAQFDLSPVEFREHVALARAGLTGPPWMQAMAAVVESLGLGGVAVACDGLRLRAVEHGGGDDPNAWAAYAPHRDTWYANPRAQINWWIPLHDVARAQSFALFPAWFDRAIDNDSHRFDYAEFRRRSGWQAARVEPGAVYPTTAIDPRVDPWCFEGPAASVMLFSAAHLHATQAHHAGSTRFSVDFRTVDLGDVDAGLGATDPDNRATGSALPEYRRLWR